MSEERIVFFYEGEVDEKKFDVVASYGKNSIFVRLIQLRQNKSTLERFLENEVISIPIFAKIFSITPFYNILKFIQRPHEKVTQNNELKETNIEVKDISNYIDADVYERANTTSVSLFNKIKTTPITKRFIFSGINLFETNRLEIVENYNSFLLIFFAIVKLIQKEKPIKIILDSSVNHFHSIIIRSIVKRYSINLIHYKKDENNKKSNLQKYQPLIERLWYWNLWKILNPTRWLKKFRNYPRINLIFAHYKNHFPALIQVLNNFSRSENIKHIIYTPHKLIPYSKNLLRINQIKYAEIIPHIDTNYSQFKKYYIQFQRLLEKVIHTSEFSELSIEGVYISTLIKYSFLQLYEKFLNSFRYLTNIKKLYKEIQPKLITVMSGNDAIDVLATRIAKKNKISSLFFPHALFSIRRDHDAFEQDYVVCAGEKDKEYFSSLGTEYEKMTILGLPLYDKLYKKYGKKSNHDNIKQKVLELFNISSHQKMLILVTTNDEDFVRERVFRSVLKITEKNEDYFLIVKIHPVENVNYYYGLAEKYHAKKLVVVKDFDLHKLLIASDVVIGRSSGAQIEAILLDKNVIDLSYEATLGRQQMEKFKAVVPVYDPNDLEDAIKHCLYDKDTNTLLQEGRKKYINYSLYKFDGKASLRIKNLIEQRLK